MKVFDHGSAGPDDPIYTSGVQVFTPYRPAPKPKPRPEDLMRQLSQMKDAPIEPGEEVDADAD